jgi:hypothetical protein
MEGTGKLKKVNDLIRAQNPDFLACSIVPQTSTLPHAPLVNKYFSMRYEIKKFKTAYHAYGNKLHV